jgi:hypothetical protein
MWVPVQVDPTGMHAIPVMAQPPVPPRNRALMVAVAIASAAAAVAISAVMWGRGTPPAAPPAVVNPGSAACVVDPATGSTTARPVIPAGTTPAAAAPAPAAAAAAIAPAPSAPSPDPGAAAAAEQPAPSADDPLAGGPCRIHVTSNATAAEIYVGGKPRGVTPATIGVPCEPTTVTVKRNRYEDYSKKVRPTERGVTVKMNMDRPNALLKIVSAPSGAAVAIEGREVGKTPLVHRVDAYESYDIVVSADGMESNRRRLRPRPGTNVIAAKLKKKR